MKVDKSRRYFLEQAGKGFVTLALLGAGVKGAELVDKTMTKLEPIWGNNILPKGPAYDKWTNEEKIAFRREVAKDRFRFGSKAQNKRKWWYEIVAELGLTPQIYKLSCEFNCLYNLLQIKGIGNFSNGTKITEQELIDITPINVNPNLGRPKNLDADWGNCPPDDYGIYAKALARSIAPYLPTGVTLNAFDSSNFNPDGQDIREQYRTLFLQQSLKGPFMFWFQQEITYGTVNYYDSENGQNVLTAPTEHCGICVAATGKYVLYIDPLNLGMYTMNMDGENGLIARAQNVGFNMLSVSRN